MKNKNQMDSHRMSGVRKGTMIALGGLAVGLAARAIVKNRKKAEQEREGRRR